MANEKLNPRHSVETILPSSKDDDNFSDWSVMWSTSHVAGMDTATGGGRTLRERRQHGRRRLRMAALSLGGLLCMHCRVVAYAFTNGVFLFLLLTLLAMLLIGNSIRHFEVYLGQWSISGPGRAFRIIPSLDGIGIAICIHALFRAITCVGIAAVAGVYILSAIHDQKLPLFSCRDFNLNYYDPTSAYITRKMMNDMSLEEMSERHIEMTTADPHDLSWQQALRSSSDNIIFRRGNNSSALVLRRVNLVCNETYPGDFPPLFRTSAYNHFNVEVMLYRVPSTMKQINLKHLIIMMILYALIWLCMIIERIKYGRIIWNNMYKCICFIPWVWACLVIFLGVFTLFTNYKGLRNVKIGGSKELLMSIIDAFEVVMYIHASALGSEIIHGKGLNYYASGHIDSQLNSDALWHSALLMILTGLITGGAATCALTDQMQMRGINRAHESSLWAFPMYAKCAAGVTGYTHIVSTFVFSGLLLGYMAVAFVCIKSALHAIFEYRVKLIFIEQIIVFSVIFFCAGISVLFSTDGGLALLEAFDGVLAGLVTPLICTLELISMMFVYRSRDFVSDMNVATEDNVCSTRIGVQWQIAPFLCAAVLLGKCVEIFRSEIPSKFLWSALGILFVVILVVPLRAAYNVYALLHPPGKN